ncbi:putative anaphase-promoting complex component Cut20/Apc4 [Colletotrichum sublineola]|uniref:Putative anaphase-promoting complex component Cut20/Apc4 n=1 Tax=Colletotrichum sublineola TaxID=1173701 RepID=A0A066X0V3_COLSU|nr:putative anaphase-promoting complex component Cut20/Apc4 [Colletotrichum sublineola]
MVVRTSDGRLHLSIYDSIIIGGFRYPPKLRVPAWRPSAGHQDGQLCDGIPPTSPLPVACHDYGKDGLIGVYTSRDTNAPAESVCSATSSILQRPTSRLRMI